MGSLSQEAVKSLLIPFPPRPLQDKIVREVQSRIQKAKQLKGSGKMVLEEAKSKVQKIILGTE